MWVGFKANENTPFFSLCHVLDYTGLYCANNLISHRNETLSNEGGETFIPLPPPRESGLHMKVIDLWLYDLFIDTKTALRLGDKRKTLASPSLPPTVSVFEHPSHVFYQRYIQFNAVQP